MDQLAWLTGCRVLFVVGKGGVGKSTTAATVALAAARGGAVVDLVELEGRPELARSFNHDEPLGTDPVSLWESESGGAVRARRITPDTALTEWLGDHGFGRLLPRLVRTGALEIVATAVPGIREVLVLGKVKALARESGGLVVVDAPATGHALSLLTAPRALVSAARSGPIRHQGEEVDALLRDARRSAVLLVTLAAELPVTEVIEAAFDLEDRAGVALAAVLVNRLGDDDPDLAAELSPVEAARLEPELAADVAASRRFTLAVRDEQRHQRARLTDALPLPQVVLPELDTAHVTLADLEQLADALVSRGAT